MNASALAQSAYGLKSRGVKSERETEYQVIGRVTGALIAAREAAAMPAIAQAIYDNSRLWSTLASDLLSDENGLPDGLRGQLLSLAQFSLSHGHRVLQDEAEMDVLIDINESIMRGLRGVQANAA